MRSLMLSGGNQESRAFWTVYWHSFFEKGMVMDRDIVEGSVQQIAYLCMLENWDRWEVSGRFPHQMQLPWY